MQGPFEITYSVAGGQIPVSALLKLDRDGQGRLSLGTYRSLPPPGAARVGTFAGPAPAASLEAMYALVQREGLVARQAPPMPGMPGMVQRRLVLEAGDRKNTLALGPPDPALDALEGLLVEVMRGLLDHPIQALALDEGADAQAVTLRSVGSEPVSLMLFDPAMAGRYLRVARTLAAEGTPDARSVVPREHIAGLVEAGLIPAGVIELAAGDTIRVPLPPLAQGASGALRVEASFYLAGPGPARRVAELEIGPIALSAAP